jgi:predicted nucleic-acid-binding protein
MGRSGILSRLSGREISYRMQILDKVLSSRKIVVQVINAAREALRLYRPRNTDFAD